jgi:hypothetical protein
MIQHIARAFKKVLQYSISNRNQRIVSVTSSIDSSFELYIYTDMQKETESLLQNEVIITSKLVANSRRLVC